MSGLPDAAAPLPDAAAPGSDAQPHSIFSRPDASVPASDGSTDSLGVPSATIVSSACGPEGAGLQCTCTPGMFSPPPTKFGEAQAAVASPDPASVIPFHSMAEFDALAVGRWQRVAGQGELICEEPGIEITADHRLIPLAYASDGSVQAFTSEARSFSISFNGAGTPLWLFPGLITNPPVFYDEGRSIYLLYAPWPATYTRIP
jgi:hypothetical protein